jgi:Kyakuja-Dileera-Zisupton transposase
VNFRYVNIDYIFLSSLKHNPPPSVVVSYDIACQWSVKLYDRCDIYPPDLVSNAPNLDMRFLVPKFHLPAHVQKCQADYSFNWTPFVGRTDGEAPERGWSEANAMAASTKEMGPGSRRDTLDDHFGDRNWGKIAKMGIPY